MHLEKQEALAERFRKIYREFNLRNLEFLMEQLADHADWPKGMTGDRAVGHAAIREYWTTQWTQIRSQVTPVSYRFVEERVIAEVHQLIKDLDGAILSDSTVYHSYVLEADQIVQMHVTSVVPEYAVNVTVLPA